MHALCLFHAIRASVSSRPRAHGVEIRKRVEVEDGKGEGLCPGEEPEEAVAEFQLAMVVQGAEAGRQRWEADLWLGEACKGVG